MPIGTVFKNRIAAKLLHPLLVGGIYGRADGARSVVLSKYYDDEDYGDHFTYIGSGGKETGLRTGPQIQDQSFDNLANASLVMSAKRKKPVRVLRSCELNSKYAPLEGLRYDGLYIVSNPRYEISPKGFKICKFDFERCPGQPPVPTRNDPDGARLFLDEWHAQYRELRAADVLDDAEEDEDYEYHEDVFGDADDVEDEMRPVAEDLDALHSKETPQEERSELIVAIGQHVERVLANKAAQGRDEAGRDAGWWHDALWSYVACALPTKKLVSASTAESWYRKRARKFARKGTDLRRP